MKKKMRIAFDFYALLFFIRFILLNYETEQEAYSYLYLPAANHQNELNYEARANIGWRYKKTISQLVQQ